ncbi:hypothetical protein [Flavobacterium sp.]|uniref:hypothetical protein n=1 Tax=Flavobacterium sp. TaxID=239 RepID=UPI00286D79BD|nr:hypothetical protein [Flavobacterium sp.]
MKKFIKQISLFLFPLIIFAFIIDFFISKNLKKSNSFAHKEYSIWNDILDKKINADVLIYGSSRAWVQIDPSMISNNLKMTCYNLGIDGHNFWLQNLRHVLFLENNQKPKLIIHSLDIFTLSKIPNLVNSEQFLPYMLFDNKIKNATISYKGFKITDYYLPLIRYYGNHDALKTAISMSQNNENKIERINGYQGQDKKWDFEFEKAKKLAPFIEIPFDQATLELFDNYIKECKLKNIKLIFVYTPEYIDGQLFVKNRKHILDTYIGISKKYAIPFYDYSNDSISFNKKLFYNTLHLNKNGSQLFSKKFIDTLKNDKIIKSLL